MKRPVCFVIVITIIVMSGLPTGSAANAQGLSWFLSEGQRIDHESTTLSMNASEPEVTKYYVEIENLPTIPTDVDTLSFLSGVDYWTYYENGTPTPVLRYKWYALPVGNWTHIRNLWLDTYLLEEDDIIETSTTIGYNMTTVETDLVIVYSEVYSKTSGALYEYYHHISSDEMESFVHILIVQGIEPLVIAAGIGVPVAVLAVVLFMYRRKKMS